MALSIVSILSHPCSSATWGRYVAEKLCFTLLRVGTADEDDNGDGALDGDGDAASNEGCGNVI